MSWITDGSGLSDGLEDLLIYGDEPGINPFAIWPARATELESRLKGDDPTARRFAAEQAAEEGDGDAMAVVGVLEQSAGDVARAEHWFRRASNAGSPTGMGFYAALQMGSGTADAIALFASAALCGNGRARAMLALAAEATVGMDDPLPQGLELLDHPGYLAGFIANFPRDLDEPSKLPILRRSAELGWAGSLGSITWWALMNGHLQLGIDQGVELMAAVSVNSAGHDAAHWAFQLGNTRSNMAFLRLCQGSDASQVAGELPMWAGHMGQGLAPTEVFLIPLLAQRRTGDLAGARDALARWPQADIDECRRVASEMASGVGPVTGIASEIMTLLP